MRCLFFEKTPQKYTGLKMDFKSNHVSFAFQSSSLGSDVSVMTKLPLE